MRGLQIYDNPASLQRREVGTSMAKRVKRTGNSLKEKHGGKKSRLRTKRRGDRVQTKSKKKPVKILAKKFRRKRQMIGAGVRTLLSSFATPIPMSGIGKNHDAIRRLTIQAPSEPPVTEVELQAIEFVDAFGSQTLEDSGRYKLHESTGGDSGLPDDD